MNSVVTWCAEVDEAGLAPSAPRPAPGVDERLRVVLVGPFSAGKTSLIKRCLAEWGTKVPEFLAVGVEPTTFEAVSVESVVTLVDTPGRATTDPSTQAGHWSRP